MRLSRQRTEKAREGVIEDCGLRSYRFMKIATIDSNLNMTEDMRYKLIKAWLMDLNDTFLKIIYANFPFVVRQSSSVFSR